MRSVSPLLMRVHALPDLSTPRACSSLSLVRHWNRAQENYQEAMDLYISYKGPNDLVVQDLEHRLREVAAYVEDD